MTSSSMSENASSRRSSASIISLNDVVDSAGVHARTSSVNNVWSASRSASIAARKRAQRRRPRLVRRHLANSLALADSNSASVNTPDSMELAELLQITHPVVDSHRHGRRHPASRREPLLQLTVVRGLLGAVAREGERHPRLAGPVQEQHGAASLPTAPGFSPSAPGTRRQSGFPGSSTLRAASAG